MRKILKLNGSSLTKLHEIRGYIDSERRAFVNLIVTAEIQNVLSRAVSESDRGTETDIR